MLKGERSRKRRARHCKGVTTALHMVVCENRTAHDGQIGVRADKIVRELLHKAKQLGKAAAVDLHRRMLARQGDTMLVIVHVGGVLQIPIRARHLKGDLAQVAARRVAQIACVALILVAEQALRITALRQELGGGDRFGVLFGLGEVDGDVDLAVFALRRPFHILGDAVGAYVVGRQTKVIKIVGRGGRILLIQLTKATDDLARAGGECRHYGGIEEVAIGNAVLLDKPYLGGVVIDIRKDLFKRGRLGRLFRIFGKVKLCQQGVDGRMRRFQRLVPHHQLSA